MSRGSASILVICDVFERKSLAKPTMTLNLAVSNDEHDPSQSLANGTANGRDRERLRNEEALRLKVDIRLCSIAGLLCSLNLLDSGIISSASVTSMLDDLELAEGNRYSVAILIFTVAAVGFQLPATIAVRQLGPRRFFACITISVGLITLVSFSPRLQSDQ